MHIHVLGSGAGGGFPQWNCNCDQCSGLRAGTLQTKHRNQSSITISADDEHWVLLNASPDIRNQLANFSPMQPNRQIRDTGIEAVILSDAQIDHTSGLIFLREGKPLDIYCTAPVHEDLNTGFPIFNLLKHYCDSNYHEIDINSNKAFNISNIENLSFTAVPMISKAPPYSPHRQNPQPGDTIGLHIIDERSNKSLFYSPGIGVMEEHLYSYFENSDCLLIDGSFWTEDEMITKGVGIKPAKEMGHLPQSGPNGIIEILKQFNKPRKILIHINNTNPILLEDSKERKILQENNIEVAYDGMDVYL